MWITRTRPNHLYLLSDEGARNVLCYISPSKYIEINLAKKDEYPFESNH